MGGRGCLSTQRGGRELELLGAGWERGGRLSRRGRGPGAGPEPVERLEAAGSGWKEGVWEGLLSLRSTRLAG